jgi:energy-coupling factor transport system ATP-binding protein
LFVNLLLCIVVNKPNFNTGMRAVEEVGGNFLMNEMELIDVSAVVSGYADKQPSVLLEHLSFRLAEKDWVYLTGPNGSGKSTLARLLAGHTANLHIEGKFRAGFAGREPIPYVMQRPDDTFVGMTPWEDVVIGLEQQGMKGSLIPAAAEQALRQVGLGELMHRSVDTLSGGQKQLVAVAACVAVNPRLLILDEAGAMLDPESGLQVLAAVKELWKQGTAVVWISQQLEELSSPDRLVAMDKGKICYDGNVDGFFETEAGEGVPVCSRLGYSAPYAVETALELRSRGIPLKPLPLTPEELAKAVNAFAR